MVVAYKTFITPEEYLARERLAEIKSEYVNGQIVRAVRSGHAGAELASIGCRLIAGDVYERVSFDTAPLAPVPTSN